MLDTGTLVGISIHAAREGGDDDIGATMADNSVFQSTPPVKAATYKVQAKESYSREFQSTPPVKAATDHIVQVVDGEAIFQSTPPVKAATSKARRQRHRERISIHAAREGGDLLPSASASVTMHFNPRRP